MLDILDKSIAELKEALPKFSLGELELLREAEHAGKTRKGALDAIVDTINEIMAEEPEEPAPDSPADEPEGFDPAAVEVESIIPGQEITLHDGTLLQFGEKAEVPAWLAATLLARKQAR